MIVTVTDVAIVIRTRIGTGVAKVDIEIETETGMTAIAKRKIEKQIVDLEIFQMQVHRLVGTATDKEDFVTSRMDHGESPQGVLLVETFLVVLHLLGTILMVHGVIWIQIGEGRLLLETFLKGRTVIEKGTDEVNVLVIFQMAHLSAIEKEVGEVLHHVTFLVMIEEALIEKEIDEDRLLPTGKATVEAPHPVTMTADGTRVTLLIEKVTEEDPRVTFTIAAHHRQTVMVLICVETKISMVRVIVTEVLLQVIVASVLTTGHLLAEKNRAEKNGETEDGKNPPS
mmetsp:Transcript_18183/g.26921  ORF Transcript_18183/g.26921 Transcript_18183/m.26921 type:complete len:284 (+) Transcript_18183:2187-3038(+)